MGNKQISAPVMGAIIAVVLLVVVGLVVFNLNKPTKPIGSPDMTVDQLKAQRGYAPNNQPLPSK